MNPAIAARILAPTGAALGSYKRAPERHAETDQAETVTSPLHVGSYATIQVGAIPVRVSFNSNPSSTDQVDITDLRLAEGSTFTYVVDSASRHIHFEADGAGAYEVWVWRSS